MRDSIAGAIAGLRRGGLTWVPLPTRPGLPRAFDFRVVAYSLTSCQKGCSGSEATRTDQRCVDVRVRLVEEILDPDARHDSSQTSRASPRRDPSLQSRNLPFKRVDTTVGVASQPLESPQVVGHIRSTLARRSHRARRALLT